MSKIYNELIKCEDEVKKILEDKFNTKLNNTSKYHITDFTNNDFEIELKSRNSISRAYPTTMIGQNKIEYMRKLLSNKRCILCFKFTDGLYYVELTKEILDNDLIQNKLGGRVDRNKNECKKNGYCYVPISILTKI